MTTLKLRANGIHSVSFFTACNLEDLFLDGEDFSFDKKVVAQEVDDMDKEDEDIEDLEYYAVNDLTERVAMLNTIYEPRIYDIDIALECGLIPFSNEYYGDQYRQFLAYGGCGMDMTPRLEAYQYLVDGTIDRNGELYKMFVGSSNNKSFFYGQLNQVAIDKIKHAIELYQANNN